MNDRLAISVVVPTYNRPEALARCLGALAAAEPPPGGAEVIVVDDGSPEPVTPLVESFSDRLNARPLRQANSGPAVTRNTGAAAARGALIAFTDDDCTAEPGWLCALAEAAEAHPGALLAGPVINALPDNPFSSASQLLIDYLMEYFGPSTGRPPLVTTSNLAVPTDAFHAVGGFGEAFGLAGGEDRDFCARWHESGRPFAAAPEAAVRHHHAMGLGGFVRQHHNYGRGAYDYHLRRPAGGLAPEPLRFYADLVTYPLRASKSPRAWLHAGLLGVSQVANATGYVAGRWGR